MKSYEKNEVEINPDDGQSSASLRHKTADLSVDGDHCLSVDGDPTCLSLSVDGRFSSDVLFCINSYKDKLFT